MRPWTSQPVLPLLRAPAARAVSLGRGYVRLPDGYVLALVPPGKPRMPNGHWFPCQPPAPGTEISTARLGPPGQPWNPVPVPLFRLAPPMPGPFALASPGPASRPDAFFLPSPTLGAPPDPFLFAGRGPGLTPEGDDFLAGYAAGLVLWHGRRAEAIAIAEAAAPLTTALSATLLRHAARGELPEPAHVFLETGAPGPLLSFGSSSGRALLHGLALGCASHDAGAGRPVKRLDELLEGRDDSLPA